MKQLAIGGLAALLLLANGVVNAQEEGVSAKEIEETRQIISEWVQARRLYSKEKSEWVLEKELIGNRIALFEREIEELQEQITGFQDRASEAERQRTELAAEEDLLRAAERVLKSEIAKYEAQIRAISDYLPEPLLQKIDDYLAALPDPGQSTNLSVGQRLGRVVAILNEIDKFDGILTLSEELREVGGSTLQVRTLYLGLGMAIYVDSSKTYAGIGVPAKGGWQFTAMNDIAQAAATAIGVYDKSINPPVFATIPVEITDVEANQ